MPTEEGPGWVPGLLWHLSVLWPQQVLFLLSLSFLSSESENTPFAMQPGIARSAFGNAPVCLSHLVVQCRHFYEPLSSESGNTHKAHPKRKLGPTHRREVPGPGGGRALGLCARTFASRARLSGVAPSAALRTLRGKGQGPGSRG